MDFFVATDNTGDKIDMRVCGKDVMLWKKWDSFFYVFTISHNLNVASGRGDGEQRTLFPISKVDFHM